MIHRPKSMTPATGYVAVFAVATRVETLPVIAWALADVHDEAEAPGTYLTEPSWTEILPVVVYQGEPTLDIVTVYGASIVPEVDAKDEAEFLRAEASRRAATA